MKLKRRIIAFCAALVLLMALTACAEKPEEKAYFTAEPTEIFSVADCGYRQTEVDGFLSAEKVTVTFGKENFSFDDVTFFGAPAAEDAGVWHLIGCSPALDAIEGRDELDDPIPAGIVADALDALIPAEFPEKAESVFALCSSSVGVQMRRELPDGTAAVYYASPEGYLFTPAEPAEYETATPEMLNNAQLASGLRYAPLAAEDFARIAAWEAAYSGAGFREEARFVAFSTPAENAADYRLCISSAERHLDLSLAQAKEFLGEYLGCRTGEVSFADFAFNPAERPGGELIQISEYSSNGEIEATSYLAPSGKLLRLRNTLAELDAQGGFFVNAAMLLSSEETFSYEKVQELLTALAQ